MGGNVIDLLKRSLELETKEKGQKVATAPAGHAKG